jgi:ribosomal protein S18 acetylase RimI-like enzyme
LTQPASLEIIAFDERYADAFRDLNVAWLEKYFRVEAIDAEILGNPQAEVIAGGGEILFARSGETIVGTVALRYHGEGCFELTKMAVDETCRGRGIGRQLLEACVVEFGRRNGRKLFLESHSSLSPALALYETGGFEHAQAPQPSDYERADVYMIYRGG